MHTPRKTIKQEESSYPKASLLLKISLLILLAIAWNGKFNQTQAQNNSLLKEVTISDLDTIKNRIINSWAFENQTEINEFKQIRDSSVNRYSRKFMSKEVYDVYNMENEKFWERIIVICCLLDLKQETSIWKFSFDYVKKSSRLSMLLSACSNIVKHEIDIELLDKDIAELDELLKILQAWKELFENAAKNKK